jgi:hypothetical protein
MFFTMKKYNFKFDGNNKIILTKNRYLKFFIHAYFTDLHIDKRNIWKEKNAQKWTESIVAFQRWRKVGILNIADSLGKAIFLNNLSHWMNNVAIRWTSVPFFPKIFSAWLSMTWENGRDGSSLWVHWCGLSFSKADYATDIAQSPNLSTT